MASHPDSEVRLKGPTRRSDSKVRLEGPTQRSDSKVRLEGRSRSPDSEFQLTVYTIGHSTRALDEFIALLHAHGVTQLADIRTIPKSRRHLHFVGLAMSESLPAAGISYRHFPGLGGLRKPVPDSPNSGWRHAGFRGYADYMQTPAFTAALEDLIVWSTEAPTAVMCAEAVWWQCHRQLVADALTARGVEVCHITSARAAPVHSLTSFARVDEGRVTYPGLI